MRLRRSAGPGLDERLAALSAAVEAADGVVDGASLAGVMALLQRAGERLGHGVDHTVVALAGATGSGKSSLFNALAGSELSTVGVRRPVTSTTHACSWGRDATALLDWLHVDRRHHIDSFPGAPDGLVLLDLPDHDSVAVEHRREVDRIVAVADLVVWVLDPQKYGDRALHERYLQPLAGHAGVLLVTLHQADRLTRDELDLCRRDLARLLVEDGLSSVPVLTSSVRQEGGLDTVKATLRERVEARDLAIERLEADVTAVSGRLARHCAAEPGDASLPAKVRDEVVTALTDAAGVDTVTGAVAGSYRSRAAAATGWPATRWLRKVRPDPLRRLHLGGGSGGGDGSPTAARTSLPRPTSVTTARAETAVRSVIDAAGGGLPLVWGDAVRQEVEERATLLPDRLDSAIASTDLGMDRPPTWWRLAGLLQTLLFLVAVAGGLWLAALFGLSYLQLSLDTPRFRRIPLPTLLLAGGVAAGILLAFLARRLASLGGRRRARRARGRLESSVRRVAEVEVFGPVEGVLERHHAYCASVKQAGGS